jgi:phage host-nuclease inhibitor protein Gam
MSAAKKAKLKAPAFPVVVPQSEVQANEFVYNIGELQRHRIRIETEMNDRLAALKDAFEETARPYREKIESRLKGLQIYCAANRAMLTSDGKVKFHEFPAGEISWRQRPPSVAIRGVEKVLAILKATPGLGRFIRLKAEIDKEQMLAEPDAANMISGVTVGSTGEDFIVKPFETKLEEVA